MQKIVDDVRLIVKCCKLYYEENCTQSEIGNSMGISRPTVSRMLKEGKRTGIVKIEILSPLTNVFEELERQIERRFGVKEVIIVEDETDKGMQQKQAAKAAAAYLQRIIKNGDVIGVSMGTSIKGIADYINWQHKVDATFVPMVGGIGQSNMEIHPNEIVKDLARAFDGNLKLLHAPAVVSNANIKRELIKDTSIKEVLDYTNQCDIAIVGIGSTTDLESTMMTTGYFSADHISELERLGAVGDVCLQFYDINGNTARFAFNERVVGADLTVFRTIKTKIGVACGDKKVQAIIGALNSKTIDVLVTNYSNAVKLDKGN